MIIINVRIIHSSQTGAVNIQQDQAAGEDEWI